MLLLGMLLGGRQGGGRGGPECTLVTSCCAEGSYYAALGKASWATVRCVAMTSMIVKCKDGTFHFEFALTSQHGVTVFIHVHTWCNSVTTCSNYACAMM